jgi:hypothetical protein
MVSFGASEAVKISFHYLSQEFFIMFFQLTLFGSSLLVVDMIHATGGGLSS